MTNEGRRSLQLVLGAIAILGFVLCTTMASQAETKGITVLWVVGLIVCLVLTMAITSWSTWKPEGEKKSGTGTVPTYIPDKGPLTKEKIERLSRRSPDSRAEIPENLID